MLAFFCAIFAGSLKNTFLIQTGPGVATGILIPWSILPDIIDLEELKTGKRREGDLYAMFSLFQKVGLGLAMSISGYVLSAVGYVAPPKTPLDGEIITIQPASVELALRIMLSLVPAGLLLISLIVMAFYPLNKQKHREIMANLINKRKNNS